jgi:hypothetical protein
VDRGFAPHPGVFDHLEEVLMKQGSPDMYSLISGRFSHTIDNAPEHLMDMRGGRLRSPFDCGHMMHRRLHPRWMSSQ